VQDVLKNVFGYDDFRPGQRAPIEALLRGENVFCIMPTGAGKSIIYQIPALVRGGLTVVVSPLIALMQDQISGLRLLGVEAETLNSSRSPEQNATTLQNVKNGKTRLLYLAPERLMQSGTLDMLKRIGLQFIAIDEAHCISQWGPSFRPEYELLTGLKTHFPDVPIAALTASADDATRKDIADKLFNNDVSSFIASFDRPNICLTVEPKQSWKQQLLKFVKLRPGTSGIVYCLSRKKTEAAAQALRDAGHNALAYHAGMEKSGRERNQEKFVREPGIIMAATIAFGMGIDKPDVRFVFHTDMPASMEAYYQEIGRAGRDGDPAEAHMLFGLDDIRMRRQFIEQAGSDDLQRRREHKRLDALIAFCEAPKCRRQTLLAYFSDHCEPCGNCDGCLNPVALQDGLREGQMILSAMARTGQKFGPAHIIDILLGADTARLRQFGHDKLPTWGVGKMHSKNQWRSIIRQLVAGGFAHLDVAGYGGISVTKTGKALMKGEENFSFRPMLKEDKPAGRISKVPADEIQLDADQLEGLAKLKSVRAKLARERNVPAYVIFHDKTLREIVRSKPKTLQDMSSLYGVGQAKLDKFGALFLEGLNEK
jgi:ATP-dependent DNA helicase RecQ